METLICRREMNLIGSTSFGFAQNMIHGFQNTVLKSKWHCLRQMLQKLAWCFCVKESTRVSLHNPRKQT